MGSRFSEQIDAEQNDIQAQFDVSRAKSAIGDLVDRINSMNALGRISDADCKALLKALKSVQDKIEAAGKLKIKKKKA